MSKNLLPAELELWKKCSACSLGSRAKYHVLGRGVLPADVVFIGEGPGKSEDALGEAFVGPAGRILQKAIGEELTARARLFFTNLVACRPCDTLQGENRAPTGEEISACSERLILTLQNSEATGVILCGRLPQSVYKILQRAGKVRSDAELHPLYVPHPSWLLRNGGEKSSEFPRYCATIREYIGRNLAC